MATEKKTIETAKPNRFNKPFAIIFWILFALGIGLIVLIFALIAKGKLGYLPELEDLQNPKNNYATEIYSADGVLLGQYYRNENRVGVSYADISENMIHALVATEDVRFYEHSGIDGKALVRVLMKLGRAGGGSTLTQQLAKQLYSPQAANIFERALQKPIEWVIAVQLERLYTKEEIIMMYLNQFDFLYNAVGIKSAARVYFNTTPDQLSIEQAAMLVGMCKNPSLYNPIRRKEKAFNRRNTVLEQMEKAGYLTEAECDSIKQIPLELNYQKVDHKEGSAPYFREYLRLIMTAKEPIESDYAEWQKDKYAIDREQWDTNPLYGFCKKNTKPDGTNYDLYSDGLKIVTTLDSKMQRYAEEAVNEHMQYLQGEFFKEKKGKSYAPFDRNLSQKEIEASMNKAMRQTDRYRGLHKQGLSQQEIIDNFNTPTEMHVFSYAGTIDTVMTPMDSLRYHKHFLRCGFMSMDPQNGYVKAYVGGPNFSFFQYDMVNLGRREIGSTVKPYLFTLAMEEGMWPCDQVLYEPVTIISNNQEWTPKESHKVTNQGQMVTLRWGLAQSSNWVSANLMDRFTPQALVKMMQNFGIRGNLEAVPALCLGPCDISVGEMVDAYTTFPNKGIRINPLYVTRIEDKNGNVIAVFAPNSQEVINETTSYKMIDMLRAVVNGGTGGRVRRKYGITADMGGKTGTSQRNADGWFMGFTPRLVSGCWVGGEDRSIHFDYMSMGQGASTALPIWGLYMQKVYADSTLGYSQDEKFDIPAEFDPNQACKK
ncbi:MAG: transglycosylase domain-containing protein [Paludibacteraceae bacterium]|nr:transglycosylase domain-containing protein [Paludibacteraceae bacterium]